MINYEQTVHEVDNSISWLAKKVFYKNFASLLCDIDPEREAEVDEIVEDIISEMHGHASDAVFDAFDEVMNRRKSELHATEDTCEQWPNPTHEYSNLNEVHKFTDLKQITADEMWDTFDMHYNCVDTLPLYVSESWNLIISPADDVLSGLSLLMHGWPDEGDEWDKCWCFEWGIHDDTDDTWDGFLAEYGLGSPWEAFRVAMRYRDAFLAGKDDEFNAI